MISTRSWRSLQAFGTTTAITSSGSIRLPLVIGPKDPRQAFLRVLAAIVALAFIFKPDLAHSDPDIVRNIATVLFVLVVAGQARTLQAFWPNLPWR